MFRGERYIDQERPNISHSKVLVTCVAILGVQPNNIRSINEMLCMSVNIDWIRVKNRGAYNFNSHQLEQLFATTRFGGMFNDTVFNSELKLPTSDISTASQQKWLYPLQCPPQTKWSPASRTARFQKLHWNHITKAWLNWGTRWKRITPQSHPWKKEGLTAT